MGAFGEGTTDEQLTALAADGCAARAGSGSWEVTPLGRSAHAALVSATLAPADRDAALLWYADFRILNREFKDLCTRWQVRDVHSVPLVLNDHRDARYDEAIIGELRLLHARAQALLARGCESIPWLRTYSTRLGGALAEVSAGHTKRLATPQTDSYHDIWMELHDDLLLTLGLARGREDA